MHRDLLDFKKIKLMTLNILSGGGKRIDKISKKIKMHDPDVLIISEFRLGKSWELLQEKLSELGFKIFDYKIKVPKTNSVMIASKFPAEKIDTPNLPESELHRLCGLKVFGIKILGVYFAQKEKKKPLFKYFLEDYDHLIGDQTLIMGDMNTGLSEDNSTGKGFYCKEQFSELTSGKMIDLWRKRNKNIKEYSWMHSKYGNQFRIDHALGTNNIDKMTKKIFYSHEERQEKVTDHSALILELEIPNE